MHYSSNYWSSNNKNYIFYTHVKKAIYSQLISKQHDYILAQIYNILL